MRQYVTPATIHEPIGLYSPAVRVGNVVFVSGQIPVAPDGTTVTRNDPKAQANQCLENLKRTLEAAGASLRDIVKMTIFTTHFAHRQAMSEARQAYFAAPYPASTSVVVTSLAHPDYLFEVEAIAILE